MCELGCLSHEAAALRVGGFQTCSLHLILYFCIFKFTRQIKQPNASWTSDILEMKNTCQDRVQHMGHCVLFSAVIDALPPLLCRRLNSLNCQSQTHQAYQASPVKCVKDHTNQKRFGCKETQNPLRNDSTRQKTD